MRTMHAHSRALLACHLEADSRLAVGSNAKSILSKLSIGALLGESLSALILIVLIYKASN